jgi:hypothetical protein
MKSAIIIVFLLTAGISTAQELNVGVEFAGGSKTNNSNIFALGPIIEYRLTESILSFNSGVLFLFTKGESVITLPLNLKFIIGNKIRFCPTVGGFIRSNKNYGWSTGLELDFRIKKKFILFAKGEYTKDYYKEEIPTHFGGTNEVTSSGSLFWYGAGIKINIYQNRSVR